MILDGNYLDFWPLKLLSVVFEDEDLLLSSCRLFQFLPYLLSELGINLICNQIIGLFGGIPGKLAFFSHIKSVFYSLVKGIQGILEVIKHLKLELTVEFSGDHGFVFGMLVAKGENVVHSCYD